MASGQIYIFLSVPNGDKVLKQNKTDHLPPFSIISLYYSFFILRDYPSK